MTKPRHIFLHYGTAAVTIGATNMPQLGKRPSLMVTRGSESHKVASFQSVEAAREFTDALAEILRPLLGEE